MHIVIWEINAIKYIEIIGNILNRNLKFNKEMVIKLKFSKFIHYLLVKFFSLDSNNDIHKGKNYSLWHNYSLF